MEAADGAGSPAPSMAASRMASRPVAVGRRASVSQVPAQRFQRFADYSYVGPDLRRIGLLAGSLMVLLVALSFFVR